VVSIALARCFYEEANRSGQKSKARGRKERLTNNVCDKSSGPRNTNEPNIIIGVMELYWVTVPSRWETVALVQLVV
jgi:hypothetical protein